MPPSAPLTAIAAASAAALFVAASGDGSTGPEHARAKPSAGAAQAPRARLRRIGTFRSPTYVTAPRGDRTRLFVVEQGGTIRVVHRGRKLARPFLDIRGAVRAGNERGLLSMAFAPDYARSRRFYVYFTDPTGDIRIQEFRRSANRNRALARSARNVLRVGHRRYPNHNGGQLQFGPDGYLYAGTGDGGSAGDPHNNAQRLSRRLGKILRIDPRRRGRRAYSVPRSNPFRGRRGARPEIWAYGLRNPWRFSFDRRNGALTIGDVGQNEQEEVNYARHRGRGANYGWSVFEGRRRFRGGTARRARRPALVRGHGRGWCSVIGGYVVRDRSLPGLYGRYVYGDACRSGLRSVVLRPGRARGDRPVGANVAVLSSFGEDARGRVYAVSLSGPVYRLVRR